jgi:hypothetical protein
LSYFEDLSTVVNEEPVQEVQFSAKGTKKMSLIPFNVFKVLVTGTLKPGKELLDRAVTGGPCVRVADRDRKKLEELFAGRWPGALDDGWNCEIVRRN